MRRFEYRGHEVEIVTHYEGPRRDRRLEAPDEVIDAIHAAREGE